jgi:hypothetical protein
LGGAVGQGQLISAQADGAGLNEIIFISSGKLVVKRPDDTLLWESTPMGLSRIEGIADFDADGDQEIVASGRPGMVALFSLRDGRLRWRTNPTDFSPLLGEVRIARLNEDMLPDLYVADLAASQATPRPESMFGYSFAMGFGSGVDTGAQRLWRLPTGRDTAQSFQDVLADLNNDGVAELLAFGSRYAYLYNARTGAKIASGGVDPQGGFSLGITLPFGLLNTHVVDVDADGSLDVVGFSNNAYPLPDNSRHVVVLSYDPARPMPNRVYSRWARGAANLMTDAHLFVENTIADLDNDRLPEIVSTFREGGTTRTYVFNAATGAVRATINDASVVAVYSELNSGQPPVVLVRHAGQLEGYREMRLDGGVLSTPSFRLPDGVIPRYVDNARARGAGSKTFAVTAPIDRSMRRAIVLVRNGAVESYDVMGAMPTLAGRYAFPAETTWSTIVPQENISVMGQGLLVAQTDGYIVALDPLMRPLNQGTMEFPERGVRCGGFYSGSFGLGAIPTAGRFDPDLPQADVVTVDGRGVLARLDVSRASLARAPVLRFQRPGARFALLESSAGGPVRDRIVAQMGRSVVGIAPDGMREFFRVDAATAEQSITGDTVPLRDAMTMQTLYAVPVNGTDGLGQIAAVNTMSAVAWRTTAIATGSSIPGYLAVDELNNDSVDDVLVTFNTMKLYNGASGSLLASSRFTGYAAMPVTVRGLMATVTHLFMASAGAPAAATLPRPLMGDFDSSWVFPGNFSATRQFASVVQCVDGLRVMQSRDLNASLAIVPVSSYRTAMPVPTITLAGGRLFTDVNAAQVAGVIPGVLGNSTATQQLSPNQPAVLVGSTDGFLYAIDPCSAEPRLLWALNFRASVGQPIFADTDGDMEAEIVVTSADGFLYGVDTQAFAPPMWVNDVDPNDPASTMDVDEVTAPAIAAAWAEVPGATAYEWAVFTSGGTPLSRNPMDMSNPFTQVPPATRRVLFADGLRSGGRYFFAVRVIGPTGSSPEAVSDGVLYVQGPWRNGDAGTLPTDSSSAMDVASPLDAAMTDAGRVDANGSDGGVITAPGGCGCRVESRPRTQGNAFAWLSLGVAVLMAGQRRHRWARSQQRIN